MNRYGKMIIAVSLIFTLTSCSLLSVIQATPTPQVLADCFLSFNLSAWHDMDQDQAWDASEPPLADVEFSIDGRFASVLSEYPCLTDEEGHCAFSTWAPGECAAADYTITALPPESFEPTNPALITISLSASDFSADAQLGFHAAPDENTD